LINVINWLSDQQIRLQLVQSVQHFRAAPHLPTLLEERILDRLQRQQGSDVLTGSRRGRAAGARSGAAVADLERGAVAALLRGARRAAANPVAVLDTQEESIL
jgi:hypothetical protein